MRTYGSSPGRGYIGSPTIATVRLEQEQLKNDYLAAFRRGEDVTDASTARHIDAARQYIDEGLPHLAALHQRTARTRLRRAASK